MHFQPPFLDPEFTFKTSRSGGKGGQNVNKVSTKVQLDFNIASSRLLNEEERALLMEKLAGKLTREGTVQVMEQQERSQGANKELAIQKMYALLNACFIKRKKRKATAPTGASVQKRLIAKKKESEKKQARQFQAGEES